MLSATGLFLLGLLLLLLGGDSLVKGASGFAQRLGLSPFAAGLLLIASATSVPELAVNAYALGVGQTDLALGNAIGSNIVNIGLTLGIAAVAAPMLIRMRLLAAQVVFILIATGVLVFLGRDGGLTRWEGGLLLLGFLGSMVFLFRRGRSESAEVQAELAQYAETSTGLAQNLVRLGFAAGLLFYGSRLVIASAPLLGQSLGFGPLLTGLTLVAVGTALPEIVVAAMLARQGKGNVVVGQALGACLFNVLFIVGGMAAIRPLPLPASFVSFELPAAMAFALLLFPVLDGDMRIDRREGGLLTGLFLLWLGFELFSAWH